MSAVSQCLREMRVFGKGVYRWSKALLRETERAIAARQIMEVKAPGRGLGKLEALFNTPEYK
jgi:hypothetical protein